jgi:small basic protein
MYFSRLSLNSFSLANIPFEYDTYVRISSFFTDFFVATKLNYITTQELLSKDLIYRQSLGIILEREKVCHQQLLNVSVLNTMGVRLNRYKLVHFSPHRQTFSRILY